MFATELPPVLCVFKNKMLLTEWHLLLEKIKSGIVSKRSHPYKEDKETSLSKSSSFTDPYFEK